MFLLRTVYAPLLLLFLLCSSVLYVKHHEVGRQMISFPASYTGSDSITMTNKLAVSWSNLIVAANPASN